MNRSSRVSTSSGPRVVLMGKGRTKNTKKMHELISAIQPTQVPVDLLDAVYVSMNDSRKYKIDKKYLKNGLNYENIESQMKDIGIYPENIDLIEVVIDLDKAQKVVSSELHNLLDPYFSKNEEQ